MQTQCLSLMWRQWWFLIWRNMSCCRGRLQRLCCTKGNVSDRINWQASQMKDQPTDCRSLSKRQSEWAPGPPVHISLTQTRIKQILQCIDELYNVLVMTDSLTGRALVLVWFQRHLHGALSNWLCSLCLYRSDFVKPYSGCKQQPTNGTLSFGSKMISGDGETTLKTTGKRSTFSTKA